MRHWTAAAVGVTATVALAGFLVGFVWLPTQPQGGAATGLWSAICSAAGLIRTASEADTPIEPGHPVSRVAVTPDLLRHVDAVAVGHGATLALRCTMCHGLGTPNGATIPHLAGQPAVAVYKQLLDFRSGARGSAVMAPLVEGLSDDEMRDLAAYYAYLPRETGSVGALAPPRIVADGAPMRGIAPCGACHGGMALKAGAPRLEGQPEAYLSAQLRAFVSGGRRNDISEQMRNVARAMTADEISSASDYYARQ